MNQYINAVKKLFLNNFAISIGGLIAVGLLLGIFIGVKSVAVGDTDIVDRDDEVVSASIDSENGIAIGDENETRDSVHLDESEYATSAVTICVNVAGSVNKPGMYCFDHEVKVADVVDRAGGYKLTQYASRYVSQTLNLAQDVHDGEHIYVPYQEEVSCVLNELKFSVNQNDESAVGTPDIQEPSNSDANESTAECIDVNKATIEELDSIPGVGPSTANSIIAGRVYADLDELLDVEGIGEQKLSDMMPYICDIN